MTRISNINIQIPILFLSASEINVEKCHIEMFRHVHRYKLKGTINHNILLVKIIYFLFLSFKEILI